MVFRESLLTKGRIKTYILLLVLLLALTGCTLNKHHTQIDCIDGKIYLSTWNGVVTDESYNIKKPEYARLIRSLYLTEDNKTISCLQ